MEVSFGFCASIFAAFGGRLFRTPNYRKLDQHIRVYLDRGVSYFPLWFMDAPESEDLELIAAQIASRFR